ncbi:phosphate signaling complex PhoU family protein [Hyperthermus butylicus]|uniref:phosphate signaling complex PhoU family protein n=1 Tax=Hyperthermus butylicus TaxID=54248 RepID=UPI001891D68A|nr:phosphate uptake regulator PhoU [Hyperthermus butylicus]
MGETRRIQATGGGSYVITLPKEWIRLHRLGKGSEVIVSVEPDGSLRIRPVGAGGGRASITTRIVVEPGWGVGELVRRLVSYYVVGADVIELVFRGQVGAEVLRGLRDFVSRRLIGVEVVEESSSSIVFQVVADEASLPLSTSVRRLMRTVELMLDDLITALRELNEATLLEIDERDDVVDKFYMFISRQLVSVLAGHRQPGEIGLGSAAEAGLILMASKHVERAGDHVSRMARSALEGFRLGLWTRYSSVRDRVVEHLAGVLENYRDAVTTFLNPSPERVDRGVEASSRLRAENDEIARQIVGSLDYSSAMLMQRFLESARRIVDYNTDMFELSLNRRMLAEILDQRKS